MAEVPLLSDRAIQIIADNKIRAAIAAGEFDNLLGFGKPLADIDEPYDPNRWIRGKLKREQMTRTPTGGIAVEIASSLAYGP